MLTHTEYHNIHIKAINADLANALKGLIAAYGITEKDMWNPTFPVYWQNALAAIDRVKE